MEMTVWDFPFFVCFIALLMSVSPKLLSVAVTVSSGLHRIAKLQENVGKCAGGRFARGWMRGTSF
jgi:hypothetical protein